MAQKGLKQRVWELTQTESYWAEIVINGSPVAGTGEFLTLNRLLDALRGILRSWFVKGNEITITIRRVQR